MEARASGAVLTPLLVTGACETFAPGGLSWEDGLITHAGAADGVGDDARRAAGSVVPGFVDAVDIYVEDIAFSLEDLEAVADSAARAGLPLRVHADQLGASGAAEAAVRLGAWSADHLNHLSDAGVDALANSFATTAVLLPASTFFLRADPPPARRLIESGARVAIASDFNPGTSPTLSMPEVIAMACTLYGFT